MQYSRSVSIIGICLRVATTTLCMVGCGKVGSPKAPQYFAPEVIADYKVSPDPQRGVMLSWKAPKNDRRGKELKEIDGYSVERALVTDGDTIATAKFTSIAFIEDHHIEERDKLRAELRSQHRPSRTADVKTEKKLFSYLDTSSEAKDPSTRVMYRIVGVNQDGVRGARSTIAYKKSDSLVFVNNEDGADLLDTQN